MKILSFLRSVLAALREGGSNSRVRSKETIIPVLKR